MNFKLADYLYPFDILRLYRSLRVSEYFTEEQLIQLQNRKLRGLIEHAYTQVPYYREVFDGIGLTPHDVQTIDDLPKIPVLTKDIVRERYKDLIADNSERYRPYINRTSGSTGTPLQFLQDKHTNIARFAFFGRVWKVAGYRPFIRWAQVDAMCNPAGTDDIWRYNLALNSLQIACHKLTKTNCARVWDKLNSFRPRIVRGHPSALYTLALHGLEQNERLRRPLRGVICYSETLTDEQRACIREAFAAEVYDIYSLWEAVCIVAECEHHTKHQQMEYSVMELLDDQNQRVEAGKTGEITATSFYNYAMPFIRYKTRDLASANPRACACGRHQLAVSRIDGRLEDVLITPEGARVGALSAVFKVVSGYDYAQVIQNTLNAVDVLLVKNASYREDSLITLEKKLRERVGPKMKIRFQFVDDIKPSANGKRRLVINKMMGSTG